MNNERLYLQLIFNHLTGSGFLTTFANRLTDYHITKFLKVNNTYDDIRNELYVKFEGVNRKEFVKLEDIETLTKTIETKKKQITEYIDSYNDHKIKYRYEDLNDKLNVKIEDINMDVFEEILIKLDLPPHNREEITLHQFPQNALARLSDQLSDLGPLVLEKKLQEKIKKRLSISDKEVFTDRELWDESVSSLCRLIKSKINENNREVIFKEMNTKYLVKNYLKELRKEGKKAYERSLKSAIRSWKNNQYS